MLTFSHLEPSQFEEFCFDLLKAFGFVNIEWRKGTGLKASPADQGRDIECDWERVDVDETRHLDRWFVECKHYGTGVPPERLQSLLTWAEAERPHTALFIASSFLSNPARNYLKSYEANRRPPFEIKVWDRKRLENLARDKDELLIEYSLIGDNRRAEAEIIEAEQEFFDRVWYGRHKASEERYLGVVASGKSKDRLTPGTAKIALEAGERMRENYGREENLLALDDFEWGMLSGKLSALRWVLGDEWDFLDT